MNTSINISAARRIRLVGASCLDEREVEARKSDAAARNLLKELLTEMAADERATAKVKRAWRALENNRRKLRITFEQEWTYWFFWLEERHELGGGRMFILRRNRAEAWTADYGGGGCLMLLATFWRCREVSKLDSRHEQYLFEEALCPEEYCLRRFLGRFTPRELAVTYAEDDDADPPGI